MAIKSHSGEKITATDINALIDKIQGEYQDRSVTTTGTDRNGANASVNLKTLSESLNDVNKNDTISSNLYNIVNAILVMNDIPNLLVNEQYDIIISDGIINNADLIDKIGSRDTCRGACMGTCLSGCSGQARGEAGSQKSFGGDGGSLPGAGASYGPGAQCTGCVGSCGTGCDGCSGTCDGRCQGGCYGCSGCQGCTNTCSGCKGCTGCGSTCGGCYSGCSSHCDANCTNGCTLNCKDGCYGSAKNNTYT